MYDEILVSTDGSAHARRAAEYAATLARAFDATLHVVTVLDLSSEAGPFSAGGATDEYVEELEADAEERVDETAATVGGDLSVRTAVVRGRPSAEILAYADDTDVDLIAIGTVGRSGVQRVLAGSVAERVLRNADVPVLAVRGEDEGRSPDAIDDVLVPTDGSAGADAAVEHAIAVAERVDARVHALHAVDLGHLSVGSGSKPPSDLVDSHRSDGDDVTDQVRERAEAAGLEVVAEVVEEKPSSAVIDYVDEADIDLVAMGSTGRSGTEHLLGSTTERVVRHAAAPVLAVHAPDRAD